MICEITKIYTKLQESNKVHSTQKLFQELKYESALARKELQWKKAEVSMGSYWKWSNKVLIEKIKKLYNALERPLIGLGAAENVSSSLWLNIAFLFSRFSFQLKSKRLGKRENQITLTFVPTIFIDHEAIVVLHHSLVILYVLSKNLTLS